MSFLQIDSMVGLVLLLLLMITTSSGRHLSRKDKNSTIEFDDTFIHGDMIIPKIEDVDESTSSSQRQRRAALLDPTFRWGSSTIPYEFDSVFSVSESVQNVTMKAFQHISDHTCVRFVPRTNEKFYINITMADKDRCFSYVGRQPGGMCQLNLGLRCIQFGIVAHELGHSLGFQHEHSRPDRDNYITINNTNIRPGFEKEFLKINLTTNGGTGLYGIEYDKQSLMHYNSYTFSKFVKNGKIVQIQEHKTMYSKTDPSERLGNDQLSPKDILRINKHFSCKITTTPIPPTTLPTTTLPTTTLPTTTLPITIKTSTIKTTTTATATTSTATKAVTVRPAEISTKRRYTIIVRGKVYNLTSFGTPASGCTVSRNFYSIIALSLIAIQYCLF